MKTDPGIIYAFAASLFPAAAGLNPIYLNPRERQVMGGYLFAEAPWLVAMLGRAMANEPHLFSHLPVSGSDLLGQQERARAWKYCRDHLTVLLQIANDAYLFEQSEAIGNMNLVMEQLAYERSSPCHDDPLADERDLALLSFMCEWERRMARIKRRSRRKQKKKTGGRAQAAPKRAR